MKFQLISRRRAFATVLAGFFLAPLSGCAAVAAVAKLPWDKVVTVVVNLLTGVATVIGLVDGKEVKAEIKLNDQDLEKVKNGGVIEVELKDGHKTAVQPTVQK